MKQAPGLFPDDMYSLSAIELMNKRHFGILRLLKNYFGVYVGSRVLFTRDRGSDTVERTFLLLIGGMVCACNSLLASIEKDFQKTGLLVDSPEREPSSQSNDYSPVIACIVCWCRKLTNVSLHFFLSFVSMWKWLLNKLRTSG